MVKFEDLRPTPQREQRKPGQSRKKVFCLTCGKPGIYTQVGPNRAPAWICSDDGCDSYVGCHPGTENALGHLAGPELRAGRMRLHTWIDRLWRGKTSPTRKEVYLVLSQVMGVKSFHIAQADLEMVAKLELRRFDVERACGRLPDPKTKPLLQSSEHALSQKPPEQADLADQVDQTLLKALFGTATRRRWPSDPGGQVAAARCIQIGAAQSYVDGAGRRWISRTSLPSK